MGTSQPSLGQEGSSEGAVYLRRKITLLRALSLTIGTIIGSGIFISPKGVLKNSGNVGLSLVIWVACGILSMCGRTENFQNAFDTSSLALDKIPLAFYSGLFAYGGWFYVTFVTEEIVNPERNIPLTVIVSLTVVTVCYVLTNVAYYTVLTPNQVLSSEAVAVSFAEQTLGHISSVIPILVALSCFGALNGGTFASARMLFAGSREGHGPPLLSMIHIKRHTPLPALILMAPLVFLMIGIGDLYGLLNFNSFSRWLFMGLTTLGLMVHRYRHPNLPRPFKVPLIIPFIFTTTCLFIVGMSLYSDPVNTGMSCAITLTGLPVYFLVANRARLPGPWKEAINGLTVKLQVLMEVMPQEIATY